MYTVTGIVVLKDTRPLDLTVIHALIRLIRALFTSGKNPISP